MNETLSGFFLKNFILPAGDLFYGQRMMKRLRDLEKNQWKDPKEIKRKRDELLRKTVNTAFNESAFYKNLFTQAGTGPDEVKTAEDLWKIPVVTKEMISKAYPEGIVRAGAGKTYEVRTSGSTGKNFKVTEDNETAGWYRASFLLSLEWAGWKFGQKHLQTGITPERDFQKRMKDSLMGCSYFSAYDLTDGALDRMLLEIEKKKIRHLWGYPSGLYHLALRAEEKKLTLSMESLVSWGDMVYPEYREKIEKVFNRKLFDTYGCSEGMQIAAQCEMGTYHIHSLDVIVEYLKEDGNPAGEDEECYLVVTRLHAGPMPLLRYRVGDMGVKSSARCSCGRGYEVLGGLKGRDTDVVITPAGNRLVVHFFTGIFEHFDEIDSFQVIQESDKDLKILLTRNSAYSKEADLLTRVNKSLRDRGLEGMNIMIQFVPEIPLKFAKRRFIINSTLRQEPK